MNRCIKGYYQRPFSEYKGIHFDFQIIVQASSQNLRPTLPKPTPLSDLYQSCVASKFFHKKQKSFFSFFKIKFFFLKRWSSNSSKRDRHSWLIRKVWKGISNKSSSLEFALRKRILKNISKKKKKSKSKKIWKKNKKIFLVILFWILVKIISKKKIYLGIWERGTQSGREKGRREGYQWDYSLLE